MMRRFCLLLVASAAAASGQTASYAVNTIAGVGRPTGDNGAASTALLNQPFGMATDASGNIFFADQGAHRIRKIDSSGRITTIAGTGVRGYSGDGGQATLATMFDPAGLTLDPAGNLYFTDIFSDVVRRVASNGIITTVAGNGTTGFSGDGGQAAAAQLNTPYAVAFFQNFLYIADTGNNRVRRVAPTGVISTIAGTGQDAGSRLGGPGISTPIAEPYGLAVDGAGNLYISEYGVDRVLRLDASLNLTPLAGSGQTGEAGDGGPALQAALNGPSGLAVDASGTVYVMDQDGGRVRRIANGVITAVAGTGRYGYSGDGGPPAGAQFAAPYGLALDTLGRLLVADTQNHRIRRIDIPNSNIITIAGVPGTLGDGAPATTALLFAPSQIAFDTAGNLFIADTANHRVRRVSTSGTISTVAGDGTGGFSGDGADARSAQLRNPQGVAVDSAGNILIADSGNARIRRVNLSGTIQTVAGNGVRNFTGDGSAATLASLNQPLAVAFDAQGNFYIADSGNNRIRKVTVVGQISTIAGTNNPDVIGDNGPAFSAGLALPFGVAVDSAGNIFIADTFHSRVRKVAVNGTITTVAGNGVLGFSGDGGPAAAATTALPSAVAVDSSGNVFFTDALNGRVRLVSANGTISTIGGNGGLGFSGDGGPAFAAQLGFLAGIAVDTAGSVYISDQDNHRVRKLSPAVTTGPVFTAAGATNAASVQAGPIAPGEIIVVYGSGLGPARLATLNLDSSGKVASTLAGTTITFDGRPAPLIYTSASQVSAIVPYGLSGSTRVQITYNGMASSLVTVPVAEASPALFTSNSSGSGQAAALNQDGSVNTPQNPAARGSVVVLFGTGEGETTPSGIDGQLATASFPAPLLPVTVTIDGQTAPVLYAGTAPGQVAGVLQINVRVPDNVTSGSAAVVVNVGSRSSINSAVTISIRNGVAAQ